MNATPAKLRSGDWGVRVQGAVKVGDCVTVTTRSGKSWPATISQVIWSGEGVSLCSTSSSKTSSTTPYSNSRYSRYKSSGSDAYCGYICPVGGFRCNAKNGPCHDCE